MSGRSLDGSELDERVVCCTLGLVAALVTCDTMPSLAKPAEPTTAQQEDETKRAQLAKPVRNTPEPKARLEGPCCEEISPPADLSIFSDCCNSVTQFRCIRVFWLITIIQSACNCTSCHEPIVVVDRSAPAVRAIRGLLAPDVEGLPLQLRRLEETILRPNALVANYFVL